MITTVNPRTFGSFQNAMYAQTTGEPFVGMGCTTLMYTDRHAATVIEVKGKTITVQEDTATRADKNGMSDAQSYEYTRNENGRILKFTKRKDGRWIQKGDSKNGLGLLLGVRREYFDFSF